MSTPSPISRLPLPIFARSAAATFTDLARRARATGTPDGLALADVLSAGAAELTTLAGDSGLAGVSVVQNPQPVPSDAVGLGELLAVPLALQKSLTVALTVASTAAAPAAGTDARRSRAVDASMVAARRQAGLRVALSLAASGQLSLLAAGQLARLAAQAPGATGAVGTPAAFAPVVVT